MTVSVKNPSKSCNFCLYILKRVRNTRKNRKTAQNYRRNRFLTGNWCFFNDMQIGNWVTLKYIFLGIVTWNFQLNQSCGFWFLGFLAHASQHYDKYYARDRFSGQLPMSMHFSDFFLLQNPFLKAKFKKRVNIMPNVK